MQWTWKCVWLHIRTSEWMSKNLEACELWLENKSKLAIQMAYNVMGMVQFFPDIISHLSSWNQDDNEQYTPYVGGSICSLKSFDICQFPVLGLWKKTCLKNNITRAIQSLLWNSATLTSWYSCIQEHHIKGCPTNESGAVGWTLDGLYDCWTGGDWEALYRFWWEMQQWWSW